MNSALSTPAVPVDVRMMNKVSAALFVVALAGSVMVAAWWLVRHPMFAVTRITVTGDTSHNNAVTLRANVAPKLAGSFYTMDLAQARAAFETVPWVRKAVVRRVFPDRLSVTLQEHQPVAYWGSDDEPRLVNSFGEVFEANVGDIEQDNLPHLNGPDQQSALVLNMYRKLQAPFQVLDTEIDQLDLTTHGGWRALLETGAVIELGAGSVDEVVARTERFVRTLTQISARYGRKVDAVQTADLRYTEGYALRLRGVGTVSAEESQKARDKR